MKKIRQRLGKRLVSVGIKLYGVQETEQPKTTAIPAKPVSTGGAVVEATDEFVQWTPEQHGNVVIAEPDMITRFRREKHDDDLPSM